MASGDKRTGMPKREYAQHLRKVGKKIFWASVKTNLRSKRMAKEMASI